MFGAEVITDETVRLAIAGSKAEREAIVSALAPQVRAMTIVRLAPSRAQLHAVDDIVQAALLDLLARLSELRAPTAAGLKAYVSTLVSSKVADYLRHPAGADGPRKIASLDSTVFDASALGVMRDLLPASGLSPASQITRDEAVRRMLDELAGLCPEYREVIALAFFDQLPMSDIAERIGVSRPSASMLLIRAVRELRRNVTGSSRIVSPSRSG